MSKYRITFQGSKGTTYSYIDENYDEGLEIGRWSAPFANKPNNSTAFGLVESLMQSEDCPRIFFEENITFVEVETVEYE